MVIYMTPFVIYNTFSFPDNIFNHYFINVLIIAMSTGIGIDPLVTLIRTTADQAKMYLSKWPRISLSGIDLPVRLRYQIKRKPIS